MRVWVARCLGLICLLLGTASIAGEVWHVRQAEMATTHNGSFQTAARTLGDQVNGFAWQKVSLPSVVGRQVTPTAQHFDNEIVTTWYRIRVSGSGIANPLRPDDPPYLYIPRWQTIGKFAVYAGNDLIFQSQGGPIWNGYNHPIWLNLDVQLPYAELVADIVIRIDSLATAGNALSTIWIGPKSQLSLRHDTRVWLQSKLPEITSSAFLFIGVFALALWARERKESIYLLFSLASMLSYVRCMQYFVGEEPLLIPQAWFSWINGNATGWLILVIYFFCFRLHGRRYPKIERICIVMMSAMTFISLPAWHIFPDVGAIISFVNLLIFAELILLSVLMIAASWKSKSRDGMLLSLTQVLNVPLAIYDLLLQNYQISIENIYLLPYTTLGPLIVLILILNRRFRAAMVDVKNANKRLEKRLEQREQELEASHAKLRTVELQQAISDERQRLIRDMHDGLGSTLISALTVVERGKMNAAQTAEVLQECIDDLKLTIDSLEPVDTDVLLMLATLRYRLEPRLTQAGIELDWQVVPLPQLDWLGPTNALHVLRILQEVFSNILKHADASIIRIRTGFDETHVFLEVADNGKGFDLASQTHGRGLVNLKRRAEALQGAIDWQAENPGTMVRLSLKIVLDADQQSDAA